MDTKRRKWLCYCVMIFAVLFVCGCFKYNILYAADNFINQAVQWYSKGTDQNIKLTGLGTLVHLVNVAGTAVIAIVTVFLGIKYMLGSATGKSEVKQQMISLLVACILFFGWSNLSGLLITGSSYDPNTGRYSGISGATQLFIFSGADTPEKIFAKVFALVVFFGKIVSVVATMYIGAKYILAGSNEKAELKQKGPMFIIGILLVFCTMNVLSFISNAINTTLKL